MGNQLSNKKDDELNFFRLIDSIATKYILTQNFQDMKNLENKEYCDELVILTSDIIANRLKGIEVDYLDQRTKKGVVINKMKKEPVFTLQKKNLNKLDIQSNVKKRRVCIGIAKFYIKVAHLFSAIVSTINPVYTYKDDNGKIEKVHYLKKDSIPEKYKSNIKLEKINFCSRRINSMLLNELKNVVDNKDKSKKTNKYQIKNSLCELNKNEEIQKDGTKINMEKTVIDDIGIPELRKLYYDVFDYQNGKFIGMSDKSKKAYRDDLLVFYRAFTGKNVTKLPDNINGFEDIQLKDFHNQPACKGDNSPLKKTYYGSIKNKLYQNYANQLKKMTQNAKKNQLMLINILDDIFVYMIDPETKNKQITIHPLLTMKKLDNLIEKTRKIIIQLYINCENEFLKTLEQFETIIEKQIQENLERKIENLKEMEEITLAEV